MSVPTDMIVHVPANGPALPWRLADLDLEAVDRRAIADDGLAFRILFVASLVEAGSDLYAGNLAAHFAGDAQLTRWLRSSWRPEEVQHGSALRAYIERVWPEADWQRTFDGFFAAYSTTCTIGELEPARALELAARCMVETGTAALYGALREYAREPVLKDLAGRIFADEVRHYRHFYRHFRRYQARERHPRWHVARTLFGRLVETRTGDGYYAYRELCGGAAGTQPQAFARDYRDFRRAFSNLVRRHAPPGMPIRMGLRPLRLPPAIESWACRWSAPLYALWTGMAA